jgi:broad specificity phosphatase PhoE
MDTDGQTALLLVRHGQSIWNAERRWQGQADPPLSGHGREQAYQAAANLGTVDVVLSSPQVRALETAAIIAEQIGVGPVQVVEELRERNAGVWSGLTTDEIEQRWPGWIDSPQRPDGWEHDTDLLVRALGALDSIVAAFRGATLLVISHGGVILVVEDHLRVRHGRIPNLHGRVVTSNQGQLAAGERLELIPAEMRTGGTGGGGGRV